MNATVYFHADCLDGFAAAYAAWRTLGPQTRFLPLHHGDDWAEEDVTGRTVYLLDFSLPPEALQRMAACAVSVTQLDHHASALNTWTGQATEDEAGYHRYQTPDGRLNVIFHLAQSGARLAWTHFHPGTQLPLALAHVEDQDLWRFALPGTRAFCRQLRLQPFDFAVWDDIVRNAADADSPRYRGLMLQGEAVEDFFRIEATRLANGPLVCRARLRGEPIDGVQALRHGQAVIAGVDHSWRVEAALAINANSLFASEVGHLLAERDTGIGIVWHLSGDGEVKVSLRSTGHRDVAQIAARYGGGGHRNAAGFRMPAAAFLQEVLGRKSRALSTE